MYSNNFNKVLDNYYSWLTPKSVRTSELALQRFFERSEYSPEDILSDENLFRQTVKAWLEFMQDSTPINVRVKWATLRATFNGIYEIVLSDFDLHPELSRSIKPYVAISPAIKKMVSESIQDMMMIEKTRVDMIEESLYEYYSQLQRLLEKADFTYSDFIALRNALIFHLTVAESVPVRVLQQWTFSLATRVFTTTDILNTHAALYKRLTGSDKFMENAMNRYLNELAKRDATDITPFCATISNNRFNKLSEQIVQRTRRELFPNFSIPQLKQFFNSHI